MTSNSKNVQLEKLLSKPNGLEEIDIFLNSADASHFQYCSIKFEPCLRRNVLQILKSKQLMRLKPVFRLIMHLCNQNNPKGIQRLINTGLLNVIDQIFSLIYNRLIKDDHDVIEDLELLEHFLQTMCEITPLVKDNCKWFIAKLSKFFKLVQMCFSDYDICYEILSNVNFILSSMPKEPSYIVREHFQNNQNDLKYLVSNLQQMGDYETQSEIVEVVIRCIPSAKRQQCALSFNNNNKKLTELFVQVSCKNFPIVTRAYLIEVNKQAPNCRVFSFKYTKLQLDNKIFLQDEYSWIDFSFGSKKVCFHTSASNQEDSFAFSLKKNTITKPLIKKYEKVITITLEIELPLKEYDENLPDCEGRLIYIEFERSRNDAKEIVSSFMKFFQIRRKSRHESKINSSQQICSSQQSSSFFSMSQVSHNGSYKVSKPVKSSILNQSYSTAEAVPDNTSLISAKTSTTLTESVTGNSVMRKISKTYDLELTNKSKLVKKPNNPTRAKIYQVVEIDKNAEDADVESMASSKKKYFKIPSKPAEGFAYLRSSKDVIPETQTFSQVFGVPQKQNKNTNKKSKREETEDVKKPVGISNCATVAVDEKGTRATKVNTKVSENNVKNSKRTTKSRRVKKSELESVKSVSSSSHCKENKSNIGSSVLTEKPLVQQVTPKSITYNKLNKPKPSPSLYKINKENVSKQVNTALNELRNSFSPRVRSIVKNSEVSQHFDQTTKLASEKENNFQLSLKNNDDSKERSKFFNNEVLSKTSETNENKKDSKNITNRKRKNPKVSFSPSTVNKKSPDISKLRKNRNRSKIHQSVFDSTDGYSSATNSSIGDPSWIKEHKRKFSDKQLNIQKKEKKKMIEFTATSNSEKKGCVIKSKQLASYQKGSVREWLGSESFEFKSDCNTEDVKIGSKKVKPGIKKQADNTDLDSTGCEENYSFEERQVARETMDSSLQNKLRLSDESFENGQIDDSIRIHSSIDDLIKKPPTQSQLTHISDIINENDAGNNEKSKIRLHNTPRQPSVHENKTKKKVKHIEKSKPKTSKKKLNFSSIPNRKRSRTPLSDSSTSEIDVVSSHTHKEYLSRKNNNRKHVKVSNRLKRLTSKVNKNIGKLHKKSDSYRMAHIQNVNEFESEQTKIVMKMKQLQKGANSFLKIFHQQFDTTVQKTINNMGSMIEKQEKFVKNQRSINNRYDKNLQKYNKVIMEEIMKCVKPKK